MQIVIDIEEDVYTRLFDNGTDFYFTNDILAIAKAVRKGTPLPKGHGNLKDADALIRSTDKEAVHLYEIALAPTIIKRDKESVDVE